MISPGPLLFGIVVIVLMLLPGIVTVAAAWLLGRKVGPKLPPRLRSPRSIVLLSLVPTAVVVVCISVVFMLTPASRSSVAGPPAVIVAGVLGIGWELFLLFLTSQIGPASQSNLLGLRIWLAFCLITAASVVVLGFGLGISQGIH